MTYIDDSLPEDKKYTIAYAQWDVRDLCKERTYGPNAIMTLNDDLDIWPWLLA